MVTSVTRGSIQSFSTSDDGHTVGSSHVLEEGGGAQPQNVVRACDSVHVRVRKAREDMKVEENGGFKGGAGLGGSQGGQFNLLNEQQR